LDLLSLRSSLKMITLFDFFTSVLSAFKVLQQSVWT
jgi:hypothetical protein